MRLFNLVTLGAVGWFAYRAGQQAGPAPATRPAMRTRGAARIDHGSHLPPHGDPLADTVAGGATRASVEPVSSTS